MNLVVVTHKVCWADPTAESGYATDGGFPLQMRYLSQIFSTTTLVVPCETTDADPVGLTPLSGNNMTVEELPVPAGTGVARKISFAWWLLKNGRTIWRSVRQADAVHAPIPGDVGTIGILFAIILRKRLFVRHCGNWSRPRTIAERCWRFGMEMLAGGANAMLATGGGTRSPSQRNPKIEWIFSTSLTEGQLTSFDQRDPELSRPKIVIACRQVERKGTDVVIRSLPKILEAFPGAELIVAGDGPQLESLRALAIACGVRARVSFTGKLRQTEVLELLGSSDIFCFPTSASEGFPKAVLEALAAGLPVVTTKVSVLPQLLAHGGGVLLNSTDPDEVAASVISVLSDRDKYRAMSMAAIETARAFTLENWRDRIAGFLNESWGTGSAVRNIREERVAGPL